MSKTQLFLVGVYKLNVDQQLIDDAIAHKYGDMKLTPGQLNIASEAIRDEFSRVLLVDLGVSHAPADFSLEAFVQAGSGAKPEGEMYLTVDGSHAISRKKPEGENDLRVTFYLMDSRAGKPLETPYGPVPLSRPQKMPLALAQLNPFQPGSQVADELKALAAEYRARNMVREGSGFWIRALAYFLDAIIFNLLTYPITFLTIVVIYLISGLSIEVLAAGESSTLIFRTISSSLVGIGYFAFCESVYGATPGKLICGLRVVREDGRLCNLWQTFLRGIFRVVDGFLFGGVAAIIMSGHSNQRLGDVVAKTYVVSTKDVQVRNPRSAWYLVLTLLGVFFLSVLEGIIQSLVIINAAT